MLKESMKEDVRETQVLPNLHGPELTPNGRDVILPSSFCRTGKTKVPSIKQPS